MRHGIVAALAPAHRLVAVLNTLAGTLEPASLRGPLPELPLGESDEGWQMAYGEHGGATCILDVSVYLSALPDVIVAASAQLATTVVGCGADSRDGTYWLYAAREGELIRGYHHAYADMERPWSMGDPLPSEVSHPLDDPDGAGMTAALRVLGVDYSGWVTRGDLRSIIYAQKEPSLFDVGHAIADEIEAFQQRVRLASGQHPRFRFRVRDDGYEIMARPPRRTGRGLLRFLRRR